MHRLYTLFIVLMNVPTEPILRDAIGSNENEVRVVGKTHNNFFKNFTTLYAVIRHPKPFSGTFTL